MKWIQQGPFTQYSYQVKTENFLCNWSFIYTTTAFWGPENTLLKVGFKAHIFENDNAIVSVYADL